MEEHVTYTEEDYQDFRESFDPDYEKPVLRPTSNTPNLNIAFCANSLCRSAKLNHRNTETLHRKFCDVLFCALEEVPLHIGEDCTVSNIVAGGGGLTYTVRVGLLAEWRLKRGK